MSNLKLRVWQQEAFDKAIKWFLDDGNSDSFLINAAPGSGKTKCSIWIAKKLIETKEIDKVIVIAPMNTVVETWADDFLTITGEEMSKITSQSEDYLDGDHYCATWQAIQGSLGIFQELCSKYRCLLIGDEVHHAAVGASWGQSAESAFKNAKYNLILSGTPLRSDGGDVAFLTSDGKEYFHNLDATYLYPYGKAVDEHICRPVKFIPHEGKFTVKYSDNEDLFTVSGGEDTDIPKDFESKIKAIPGLKNATDFYFLTQKPQYLADKKTPDLKKSFQASMLNEAYEYLEIARQKLPNAAALVIAPNIEMAKYMHKLIKMLFDEDATLVYHNSGDEQAKIRRFKKPQSQKKWIVSVMMISEGVDIPRLRVLVHLPKARTELHFRQAIGRIVRSIDPPHDKSFAYVIMPKLRDFERHSRNILREMSPQVIKMLDAEIKEKVCGICDGLCAVTAKECNHCGSEFPKRKVREVECEQCEHLNPVTLKECEKCGNSTIPEFEVNLDSAFNTGMIIQGLTISQEDVEFAEHNEQFWIDHLEKIGNQSGLDFLQKYGAETIAMLKNLPTKD